MIVTNSQRSALGAVGSCGNLVTNGEQNMNRADVKDARTVMRRVDEHLRQAHLNLGALDESVGFVDVIHHNDSVLPCLNYVTPRRNTAWVSSKHIEDGLSSLRDKGRMSRVRFAEGLFPPVFVRSLRELGLRAETETPIMVYKAENAPRNVPRMPPETNITRVSDQQGMAIWWYIWRNAYYDVFTSGIEPLVLGRDMRGLKLGQQIDLIMYTYGFPIGVARITLHNNSAHLLAMAILKEQRNAEREKLLAAFALDAALQAGSDLVFVAGTLEAERDRYRSLNFVDYGSIVCYAESEPDVAYTDDVQEALAQPVLII